MEGVEFRESYIFNALHPATVEVTFKKKSPIYVRAAQCRVHNDQVTVEVVALPTASDSALKVWLDEQRVKDYIPAQARAIFPFCTIVMMDCKILGIRNRQSAKTFGIIIESREVLRVYKDIRAAEHNKDEE